MDKKSKIIQEYELARSGARSYRDRLDDFLDIAYARLVSTNGFKSRVREGSLSSIVWERSARVASQPPTGKINSLSKSDEGKSQLINLTWNRYVLPNANSQYPLGIKLKLWDYYSLIGGIQPMMYFYRVDDDYVGPDCRLVDMKFVFPEAGVLSPNDVDYVFLETFHSPKSLKGARGKKGWITKSIDKILSEHKSNSDSPSLSDQTTNLQDDRDESDNLYQGKIKLVTKYVKGYKSKWTTFAPDHGDTVVRVTENTSETGRIPIVFKYSMPLIDSFYGMGDIERGESLQKAIDTSVNLSLDYFKLLVFPPVLFKSSMNLSQFPMSPGARWKLEDQDFAKALDLGSNPSNAQQAQYQFLKGALLNQNGTTDTTISSSDNLPGYGKTPEALQQLQKRENARDAWDRTMLEEACTELFEGMLELIGSTDSTVPIDFNIFGEEVRQIAEAGYTDILEAYDSSVSHYIDDNGATYDNPSDDEILTRSLKPVYNDYGVGKITIDPSKLIGKYKYNIDSGSTSANDRKEEFERVNTFISMLGTDIGKEMVASLQSKGQKLDMSAVLEQFIAATGIKNRDKLITDLSESELQQGDSPTAIEEDGGEYFNPSTLTSPEIQNMLAEGGLDG